MGSWEQPAVGRLTNMLFIEKPDTRSLSALRALLAGSGEIPIEVLPALLRLIRSPPPQLHPFSRVLAYACVVKMANSQAMSEATDILVNAIETLRSATARRVGIELLWLQPKLRQKLVQVIRHDSSPFVRSLARLANSARRSDRGADPDILGFPSETPRTMGWGGLDARIASDFGLSPIVVGGVGC